MALDIVSREIMMGINTLISNLNRLMGCLHHSERHWGARPRMRSKPNLLCKLRLRRLVVMKQETQEFLDQEESLLIS